MAANDDDRRELFDLLEACLGSRTAALLMAHMPPVGWAELATKSDLAGLRSEIKGEMSEARGEMALLRAEMIDRIARSQLSVQATTIGAMIGLSGLVFAVASFAR